MVFVPLIALLAAVPVEAATPEHVNGIEQAILAAHNAARAAVNVAPLEWSGELAGIAQKRADQLISSREFGHVHGWKYGENLFEAEGETAPPKEVVADWTAELRDYDAAENSCKRICGHYTQVVWRNTKRMGCAASKGGRREVYVCEYDPPGNFVGQRPY